MDYEETSVILRIFDQCDYEEIIPENPEYKQASRECEALEAMLLSMLPEEDQGKLEDLVRQQTLATLRFSEACYKRGFQTGMQVTLEGLGKRIN